MVSMYLEIVLLCYFIVLVCCTCDVIFETYPLWWCSDVPFT